jgi:hypothetical protein
VSFTPEHYKLKVLIKTRRKEGERSVNLESILSSSCRRKILKFLAEKGPTMQLIVRVNNKYPQVNSELQILQTEEIISDKYAGRIRIISLNKENKKTNLLV